MKSAAIMIAVCVAAAAQDTATVEGVVVNKVTGAGIEGVSVWLWTNKADGTKAVTNEAGFFSFTELKPGDYSSSVNKSGYTDSRADALPLLADPPKHHIVAGPDPFRLRFELFPPAVLGGHVIGIDGDPASASVELEGTSWRADTDADGLFVFDHVVPGSYMLLARPKVTVHDFGKDQIRTEPLPTYYPSSPDRSLGETIVIRPGVELNGYEIRLQSVEVHRVRGIVLNSDGKPSAKAAVTISEQVPQELMSMLAGIPKRYGLMGIHNGPVAGRAQEAEIVTDEDGVFEFPSIPEGEWTIQVRSDWIRDEVRHRNTVDVASATLRVERHDPDELKIQFATPVNLSVSASVVLSDGSPVPPGVSVAMSLVSETSGHAQVKGVGGGGVLQFNDVPPGPCQIMAVVSTGNYYTDSIWMGSTNVVGQSLVLALGSPPIKIVLKPAGTVRGTVEEAEAGTIVLFPQRLSGVSYLVPSNAKAFELEGIPPGEYYAIALDRIDLLTMSEASYLRGMIPKATSVRLQPGSTESVQLRVNHVPK